MRRIAITTTFGLGLLLGACQQPDTIGNIADDTQSPPARSCTGLIASKDIPWDSAQRPDTSAVWEGDSLVADIMYGGGCRTHTFTPLCADYGNSAHPGKTILWVRHEGSEDPCKALIFRRLSFEASEVKAKAGPGASVSVRFIGDEDMASPGGFLPRIGKATADSMAKHSTHFTIDSSHVEGDSLIVEVAYSGGCRTHLFQAYVSNYMYMSEPGQLDIWIYHMGNGDSCEALLRKRLAFNIADIVKEDPRTFLRLHALTP